MQAVENRVLRGWLESLFPESPQELATSAPQLNSNTSIIWAIDLGKRKSIACCYTSDDATAVRSTSATLVLRADARAAGAILTTLQTIV